MIRVIAAEARATHQAPHRRPRSPPCAHGKILVACITVPSRTNISPSAKAHSFRIQHRPAIWASQPARRLLAAAQPPKPRSVQIARLSLRPVRATPSAPASHSLLRQPTGAWGFRLTVWGERTKWSSVHRFRYWHGDNGPKSAQIPAFSRRSITELARWGEAPAAGRKSLLDRPSEPRPLARQRR